jgi:hypothetical protein
MLTDIKSGSMRLALQQIYVNCYVEYVVKNPLSPVEHPEGIGVNNELFELSLSQFVVRTDPGSFKKRLIILGSCIEYSVDSEDVQCHLRFKDVEASTQCLFIDQNWSDSIRCCICEAGRTEIRRCRDPAVSDENNIRAIQSILNAVQLQQAQRSL